MEHFKKTALLISLSFALTACGGGGSDSTASSTDPATGSNTPTTPNTGTTTPTNPDTGSIPGTDTTPPTNPDTGTTPGTTTPNPSDDSTGSLVEKLDTSKTYRVQYDYSSWSGSGKVENIKQNDQGIVTEFSTFKLYGNLVGKEMAGNKNFALGRVSKGAVDYKDSLGKVETTEISTYSNGSLYFFAYNPLVNKVASLTTTNKQINCTNLQATQARLTNGGGRASFISPTLHNGNITLHPGGDIGLGFTIKSDSNETTYASSMTWFDNTQSYNGYNLLGLANETSRSSRIGVFSIGENGANSLVVGSIYSITLGNGGIYKGLASMTCSI